MIAVVGIESIADVISACCLFVGSFFLVVGGIGIVRLPDFYTRLHAGGITDTLGAGMILIALMFQAGFTLVSLKVLMILLLLLATSPTACHALAHSALVQGLQPKGLDRRPLPSDDRAQPKADDRKNRPEK